MLKTVTAFFTDMPPQTSVAAIAVDGVLRPMVTYFDILHVYRVVEFVDVVLLVNDYGVVIAELGKRSITSQCVRDYPGAR